VPGFEGEGWWEFTLIMLLFHEIHSNLMRSPLKYNRFEISKLDLVKGLKEMVYFIDVTDTQFDLYTPRV
jgi:hypothetical protein